MHEQGVESKLKKSKSKSNEPNKWTDVISEKKKVFCSILFLSFLLVVAFCCGIIYANYSLDPASKTQCIGNECLQGRAKQIKLNSGKPSLTVIESLTENEKLHTIKESFDEETENYGSKILIFLYGGKVWNKYDKWRKNDWRKCPPKYSNCRITTQKHLLTDSKAIVYNAEDMPTNRHVEKVIGDKTIKRIFLSGKTPSETNFNPSLYKDFFDLSITYKRESTIRIPYWPNDGLLPAMYRPKVSHELDEEEILDLEDELENYFKKVGKEEFLAFLIKNCSENHYPNMFVKKLREEGLINTFAGKDSKCMQQIPETVFLPCNISSLDDCSRHFERFKFIITPDEFLCTDYTTRDYWYAILAWQAVPLIYGAGNYDKHLIPNSYINMLASDYISPSFKAAHEVLQDPIKYYKTFHLWRHQDSYESFYWQCELCQLLQEEQGNPEALDNTQSRKIDMTSFWDKDKQCGLKVQDHELMRLQFVRTGVLK